MGALVLLSALLEVGYLMDLDWRCDREIDRGIEG